MCPKKYKESQDVQVRQTHPVHILMIPPALHGNLEIAEYQLRIIKLNF